MSIVNGRFPSRPNELSDVSPEFVVKKNHSDPIFLAEMPEEKLFQIELPKLDMELRMLSKARPVGSV